MSGSTAGAPSEWDPSCGSSRGGSDRAYVFVPEQTGVYRIEVDGGYDCVVAVFDEQRNDIACNDDTGRTTHSQVEPRLEAGRRYTIVVDGYHGATGSFALSVQAVSLEGPGPPPPPPGERVLVVGARREGDTSAGADRRTPPCGSAPGSPDEAWTFTPSESGVYDIAVESDFDGVLAVYAPGASEPLACNDDASSTRASRVSARLEAGTTYEVVVDGYHGARGRYAISIGIPAPAGPRARSRSGLRWQATRACTPTRGPRAAAAGPAARTRRGRSCLRPTASTASTSRPTTTRCSPSTRAARRSPATTTRAPRAPRGSRPRSARGRPTRSSSTATRGSSGRIGWS
ncbi:MAG: hypothetical protein M5U28_40130 [Sandaracinaceae bacterium]|nr:hypothetical protein [Sandaracinaceae bacterium]